MGDWYDGQFGGIGSEGTGRILSLHIQESSLIARFIFGVLFLVFGFSLTYRIYRLFRFSEWSSGFGIKIKLPSRERVWVLGIIMALLNTVIYLFAVLVFVNVDLIIYIFPFLKQP